MKEYSPSGRVSISGFILALIMIVIVGLILGIIAYLISKTIYLVPLSPLILAFLCGTFAALAVKWGKIRNSLVAILIGLLIGAISYGTYRTAEYVGEMVAAAQIVAIKDVPGLISQVQGGQRLLDSFLQEEIGQVGFLGFTEYLAQQGMTITRTSATTSSSGVELNREMLYGYWVLEILAILLIAALMARSSAHKPFCEDGNKWLKDGDFQMIGAINFEDVEPLKKALLAGDFYTAGAILAVPPPSGGSLVRMVRCGGSTEQLDDDIFITATQKKGRNRTETSFTGMMSLSAYNMLWNAVQQRRAGPQQQPPLPASGSGYQFDL
ncbi:MAG: hypothetical protein IAE89_05565 [Anaerolineae bacterium]|nr:hypothetical protein [Anaerolineae bacterium]